MTQVLVDTSVWVAHFREANPGLQHLLVDNRVVCHPWVVIEIACGTPPAPRESTLKNFRRLRSAVVATSSEILALIDRQLLYDTGCGAIDIALLAATMMTPATRLWTLDLRLKALAHRFGVAYQDH